jgi:hypothetical protein
MKPCTCDPSGKRRRELLASSISWQGLGLVLNRARERPGKAKNVGEVGAGGLREGSRRTDWASTVRV